MSHVLGASNMWHLPYTPFHPHDERQAREDMDHPGQQREPWEDELDAVGAVPMPELPATLTISTEQQFKAVSDPVRSRILGIIQTRPATAKEIAGRLGMAPGTVGHHLQVLEAAGLAQVVARRIVRGIVAKYYTRTARIFNFDFPSDVTGAEASCVHILRTACDELAETAAASGEADVIESAFPHARLSPERVEHYRQRLRALVDDFVNETADPAGAVYGLGVSMFRAPGYLQDQGELEAANIPEREPEDQ
jgi:DNA-binding transcriptional ArsR family regulator